MAAAPRWKDNAFSKLKSAEQAKDKSSSIPPTKEDWRTWTLQAYDKLDAMDEEWFTSASDSLVFIDNTFPEIVAHPALDVTRPPDNAFKTAVVTYSVLHGIVFPVAADNVNPTTGVRLDRNYANIIARLKAIQSQLSDSCSRSIEKKSD